MTPGLTETGVATPCGAPITRVVLSNDELSIALLSLGVALQDVRLTGIPHSMTIGAPDPAAYLAEMEYCGTLVGPVANRIANARADIDNVTHYFQPNMGPHILHGGTDATHSRNWIVTHHTDTDAEFQLTLPHTKTGLPGNRVLTAQYRLEKTTIHLDITATTDAPTLMNIANHSYWNLCDAPTFAGHSLQIFADHYLPSTQDWFLPTGKITPVDGTRFDFRQSQILDPATDGNWDNNFCLSNHRTAMRPVARLTGPTGLSLTMSSTEPGLQIFDGHILDIPHVTGNNGHPYTAFAGLALEAQFWPDAPTHREFPDITLRPGQTWQHHTSWQFST